LLLQVLRDTPQAGNEGKVNPVSTSKGHNVADKRAPEESQVSDKVQDLMTYASVGKGKSRRIEGTLFPDD
jgi:hypothetical protein